MVIWLDVMSKARNKHENSTSWLEFCVLKQDFYTYRVAQKISSEEV